MEQKKDQDPESPSVIRLCGDLDFRSAPEVKDRLVEAAASHGDELIVDMSAVGFVDSTGLSALFEAAKMARCRQSQIRLVGVHRNVRRLLSVCGFAQFFQVEPAVEADGAAPNG